MKTVSEMDLAIANPMDLNTTNSDTGFSPVTNMVEIIISAAEELDGREIVMSFPDEGGKHVSLLLINGQKISYDVIFGGETLEISSDPSVNGITVSFKNKRAIKSNFMDAFLNEVICQIGTRDLMKITQKLMVYARDAKGKKSESALMRFKQSKAPLTFPRHTIVETRDGSKSIEKLQVGDEILTVENGWQAVRWVGSRMVEGQNEYAPILIEDGALGNTGDLFLAPTSNIALRGRDVRNLIGDRFKSLPISEFTTGKNIRSVPVTTVQYFHIGMDRPQIIFTEGLMVEVSQVAP
jgi:hypothetical protein